MSEKELLNVKDLVVDVGEKEILHGVNLTIRPGETHVLMGPNGTGKSTPGTSSGFWKDKKMPAFARSLTGSAVIFFPSNRISPCFTV